MFLHFYNKVGTPHMKKCLDINNRVGKLHIKMVSDVHDRMGTPDLKICLTCSYKGGGHHTGGTMHMGGHRTYFVH